MQPFMQQRDRPVPRGPRHTILPETREFTEEPNSLQQSPSQTIHFLNGPRPPGSLSRRATAPYTVPFTPPPSPYPQYVGNGQNETHDNNRKWTQEDQDHVDEKVRQKALSDLVQSWMDRLQLISVITTFFAAIEAQLLGTTTPDPDNKDSDSRIDQAANAALAGAMVVHVFAAIMSFFAAFFLIRYKLSMAKREERKVELGHIHRHEDLQNRGVTIETNSNSSVWSSNPHLEQVGPFRRGQPPTHLLDHCHSLCMWLSAVGFVLAMVGVMCFAWSRLSKSASIFASACVGVCLVSGVGAIFWPASSIHRKPKVA